MTDDDLTTQSQFWCDFLKASVAEVAELSKAHLGTAKQAALAAQFVEWFSSRGEAYQHNLNVVERKIEEVSRAHI